MVDPRDLAEYLFGRAGNHVLHVLAAGARKRDQYIGHRDVDLRLFFARRDHHRKDAEQQRDQCQEGCYRIVLEGCCDSSGKTELFGACVFGLHCCRLTVLPSRARQRSQQGVRRPNRP